KRLVETKCAPIANCATQNATQNVTATLIRRDYSVGDCKRESTDVIGDDAKRDIDFLLLQIICRAVAPAASFCSRQAMRLPYNWQCRSVLFATELFQLIEDRTENVGLVIGNCSGKIREILRALNDCYGALETHSGIDMTLGQRHE